MESSELYLSRIKSLEKAVNSFAESLNQNTDNFNSVLLDLIKNGQVQKFEYSSELLWKVIKQYLFDNEGIDESSPKSVIKTFYRIGKIDQSMYEQLIKMIDHRNLFSHIYNEDKFGELHRFLPQHAVIMKQVLNIIK
jgi:nucleotidyltransferase substrate binding protein (TIGR01987 family)